MRRKATYTFHIRFDAAVMNCKWTGPRLKDILDKASIILDHEEIKAGHVAFACYATPTQQDDWYGASIELTRALSEDAEVILALEVGKIFSTMYIRCPAYA